MPPIKYDWRSGRLDVSGGTLGVFRLWPRFTRYCLEPVPYLRARWIFLRVLALCFCVGFTGFCFEGARFLAPGGLVPFELTSSASLHDVGLLSALAFPSLLWISSSVTMITVLAWAGLLCSLLLLLNIRPRLTLTLCWVFYLSLVCSIDPFLDDTLLLEAAFLALLLVPPGGRPGLAEKTPPPRLIVFLVQLLCARILVGSVYHKFDWAQAGPWLHLEGIGPYFEKVVFPTRLDFAAFYAPPFVRHALCALVVVTEVLVPFVFLFVKNRRVRLVALALWSGYNLLGFIAGNCGWFHLLALGLGFFLYEDPHSSKKRAATTVSLFTSRLSRGVVLTAAAIAFLATPVPFMPEGGPTDARKLLTRWGLGVYYTQFEVYDPSRHAVLLEVSSDNGKTWSVRSIRGGAKSLGLSGFIGPYLPRLSKMLRRAVDRRETRSYSLLGAGLLQGAPLVLEFFPGDPYSGSSLTDVRFIVERVHYTTPEISARTGEYLKYTRLGPYAEPLHRDAGSDRIRALPLYQGKDPMLDE